MVFDELLDKLDSELHEDTAIDELSIKEIQLKLPATKHKWVGRLIRRKLELEKIKRKRHQLMDVVINNVTNNEPVKLSKAVLYDIASRNDEIVKLDIQITNTELIIEYLEKVEKIMSSMTYDIKNLVELMKLELL